MGARELAEKDLFARHCGITLVHAGKGQATAKMEIQPHHLNGVGIVQGGALFTLADMALATASNAYDVVAVGLTSSITYFKAESSGILFAKATELSLRRTVATYQVKVTNEQDELIAVFQGTVYRKNPK
ncbi:MAG: PaaI family thioesterase [Bacteroidales bacterium]|jgi:acyl-CoA thioesterase|nr:PaaI family thioesterase [Bacteroidales bacterium]